MPVSADAFDFWIGSAIAMLQPATVCDIGPGAGKYAKILRQQSAQYGFSTHITGIEIDGEYVDQFHLRDLYDTIVIGDACDLIKNPNKHWDLVIIGDCIEHMRKSHAIDLLNFLIYRTGYICVVYPTEALQDEVDGHIHEAHISTWCETDFANWNILHKTQPHRWALMNLVLIKGYRPTRMIITG
jgi:hypothetical protein